MIRYTIEALQDDKWVVVPVQVLPTGQMIFSTQKRGLAHKKFRELAAVYEKIRLVKTVKNIEASYG